MNQRGFTIVELMVSLLISSLLVILLLGIMGRMSFAFREKQQLTTVQQTLAGARRAIEYDAKLAGYQIAQGFTIAADGAGAGAVKHAPVRIRNSATGPDELAFYYADGARSALVTSTGPATTITVDGVEGFTIGDLVVLSTVDTNTMFNPISPVLDAKIALYVACVVKISAINGDEIAFAENGDWGRSGNTHCASTSANVTMMYAFVARAWRVDPTRPADAVLQLDETGALLATTSYQDYATGITDLQAASYFYDGDGIDTPDPGVDPDRDWSSGEDQEARTADIATSDSFDAVPLVMSISLVGRTTKAVSGVASASTPRLLEVGNTDHNAIGDRDAVSLPSTDPALAGNHLFRYTTFAVDLRNLGVGR